MNAKVIGIFVLLLLLCVFLSLAAPASFLGGNNIENLARRTAMFGILGIGVCFVIITGGIDLSIGSTVCLCGIMLAIFLRVDYLPPDDQSVLAVQANSKQVFLNPCDGQFREGDRIRFYNGVRASKKIVGVTQADTGMMVLPSGETVPGTRLVVDSAFSVDDEAGRIAKVFPTLAYDPGGEGREATVTIDGDHSYLRARDQIHFIDADTARKKREYTVLHSRVQDGSTVVALKGTLADSFSAGWVVTPVTRRQRMSVPLAIVCVLGIAIAIGAAHGLLITKLDLPPFLVTLCGLLIYRGISRWLVRDQAPGFGNEYENNLSWVASGKISLWEGFAIPNAFLIMLVVAVVAWAFLNKTIWGRYLLALGNNEEAARYSGINTDAMTILSYVICTFAAAFGGMLFALDSNSISPSSFGNLYELYAIAAAVLGGCSLRGGEGSILGVVIGTALMRTLNNVIVLLKISNQLEYAIIGSVILIGVVADVLIRRLVLLQRAEQRRRVGVYQRILLYVAPANAVVMLLATHFYSRGDANSVYLAFLLFALAGFGSAVFVFLLIRDTKNGRLATWMSLCSLLPGLCVLVPVAALIVARGSARAASRGE